MKQSRGTSLLKSAVSTAVGFIVALAANALVLPWFGYTPSLSENLALTTIYTVISIARGYALERVFEALGWRTRMSAFALAVLAERQRQQDVEGYDSHHDDQHTPREVARAAAAYLIGARRFIVTDYEGDEADIPVSGRIVWPWALEFWKPSKDEIRRDLVRGCALGLAAGDLLERTRKKGPARPIGSANL